MARSRLRLTIYMGAAMLAVGGGAVAADTTGAAGTSNVPQTAFEFSKIFAGFRG
jgi:hypothetical protein